jgi:hypothetical protein
LEDFAIEKLGLVENDIAAIMDNLIFFKTTWGEMMNLEDVKK